MSEICIRNVPEEVVKAIDAHAAALGLSRSEYLRRQLRQDAERPRGKVTVADFKRFSDVFRDLNDPEVMKGAWRRPSDSRTYRSGLFNQNQR